MKIIFRADDFSRGVDAVSDELARRISQAVTASCIEVESAAKELCPKGSGAMRDTVPLRQSIAYEVEGDRGKSTGVVGSNLEHAVYVHEGTGIHSRTGMGRKDVPWTYCDENGNFYRTDGIEPNPFLEKAVEAKRVRIDQIFSALLS